MSKTDIKTFLGSFNLHFATNEIFLNEKGGMHAPGCPMPSTGSATGHRVWAIPTIFPRGKHKTQKTNDWLSTKLGHFQFIHYIYSQFDWSLFILLIPYLSHPVFFTIIMQIIFIFKIRYIGYPFANIQWHTILTLASEKHSGEAFQSDEQPK